MHTFVNLMEIFSTYMATLKGLSRNLGHVTFYCKRPIYKSQM